jgi:hypothetical protein
MAGIWRNPAVRQRVHVCGLRRLRPLCEERSCDKRAKAASSRQRALPSSRSWRMFPYGSEGAAQVDEGGAIQVQRRHSGPAGRGASLDEQEIPTPGKMARPALAARVEQGSRSPRLRIDRVRFGVFVAVARWARPGQFGGGTAPATRPRPDMLADKRSTRKAGRMLAILAAIAGTVAHLPPHGPRNSFTRHPCGLRDRAPLSRLARTDPGGGPIPPALRPVRHRSVGPPGQGTGSRPVLAASAGRARFGR